MSTLRSHIAEFHRISKESDAPILVTPEASRLLRGLLRLTVQAAADAAGIKRKRLDNFEKEGRPLSVRDHRWLQSAFESAGAELFMGQGKLHVMLGKRKVISYGEVSRSLSRLPIGEKCAEKRWDRYWSQKEAARISGVIQPRISAIENVKRDHFFLADQIALQKAFDAHPI